MTKRSLLLHLLLTLAAATFASGQVPAIARVTADDLAAELPSVELLKLRKARDRADHPCLEGAGRRPGVFGA